ncbi:copper resistance protein CopZ [Microvirga sp. KLBC 81]|nr:copper resistance protein CopZ [Microvirga sp. KLBC 81]
MSSRSRGALVAAALTAVSTPALAHVSFETAQTTPNSTFKAVLRIPHGCDGQPTLKVRVRIPEGIVAVKPMPKAGWKLETTKGAYVRAYQVHGETVSEGVTDIVWTGSLDDGFYDEFVFQARFTDAFQPGATVYFPVVQECEKDTEEWVQVPAAGEDPHHLASPAPGVKIVAAANAPAAAQHAGTLIIEQPWSRATPAGAKVGGGYLRITNNGKEPDRLIGGSFPNASRIEVHEMAMEGDIMRMKPVQGGLEIKPGATVELKPGAGHLMFMDLKQQLTEGQTVKGTLVFEKAGTVNVEYTVRGMGGAAPAPMEHKH